MKKTTSGFWHMEQEDVLKCIKNRPPLLMIRDAYVKPGKCIYSERTVTEDEWFFPCHFPGDPMMPGVLQLESMFNLAALAVKVLDGNRDKTTNISKITNVQFKRHIRPGDTIKITVAVNKFRRGLGFMHGEISCRDELCCEADFLLVVLDDVLDVNTLR